MSQRAFKFPRWLLTVFLHFFDFRERSEVVFLVVLSSEQLRVMSLESSSVLDVSQTLIEEPDIFFLVRRGVLSLSEIFLFKANLIIP